MAKRRIRRSRNIGSSWLTANDRLQKHLSPGCGTIAYCFGTGERENGTMTRITHGKVWGKTIQLAEDLGLNDGQEVQVQVSIPSGTKWGDGILRTAGALADDPYWDSIMEDVRQSRKLERRPLPGDEGRTSWTPTFARRTCVARAAWHTTSSSTVAESQFRRLCSRSCTPAPISIPIQLASWL